MGEKGWHRVRPSYRVAARYLEHRLVGPLEHGADPLGQVAAGELPLRGGHSRRVDKASYQRLVGVSVDVCQIRPLSVFASSSGAPPFRV